MESQQKIKCPKCGSDQLHLDKKGFSGKKAVAGAVLTGGVGLVAGTHGSGKIKATCLNCGNEFYPAEDAKKARKAKEREKQREAEIKAMKSPLFWVIMFVIMGSILYVCA